MTESPKLYPLSAMARRLRVKAQSIRQAAEAGQIPYIRVGESLLFDPSAVEAALAAQAREAAGLAAGNTTPKEGC